MSEQPEMLKVAKVTYSDVWVEKVSPCDMVITRKRHRIGSFAVWGENGIKGLEYADMSDGTTWVCRKL